jgi:hypothetical protein
LAPIHATLGSIFAPALGLLLLAATEKVPDINPEPFCRDVAAQAKPIGDVEVCIRAEQAAREEVAKRWGEFEDTDKAACISLARIGGNPTYTELLSCLELRRDARLMREKEGRSDAVKGSPH